MSVVRGPRWRWSNVPVPEPHVAGLVVGLVLQRVRPWRAFRERGVARVAGAGLVGAGLFFVAWAVGTVGEEDVADPTALVTTGPYRYSRNPMYVGWTAVYLGVALVVNTTWLLVGLPVVLVATHREIRWEERSLDRAFGAEYRAYRRIVRRYL